MRVGRWGWVGWGGGGAAAGGTSSSPSSASPLTACPAGTCPGPRRAFNPSLQSESSIRVLIRIFHPGRALSVTTCPGPDSPARYRSAAAPHPSRAPPPHRPGLNSWCVRACVRVRVCARVCMCVERARVSVSVSVSVRMRAACVCARGRAEASCGRVRLRENRFDRPARLAPHPPRSAPSSSVVSPAPASKPAPLPFPCA